MTLENNTPIYPSINLFSFLIYVKNNNGYCEFKNKYAGRISKEPVNTGKEPVNADAVAVSR